MFNGDWSCTKGIKAFVPLRHPLAVLASRLNRSMPIDLKTGEPIFSATRAVDALTDVASHWRTLIEQCAVRECFFFPLATPVPARADLLTGGAAFVGSRRREAFAWTPLNCSSGPIKDEYERTGNLPIDTSPLDLAVDWYARHNDQILDAA
jgi:hypothetical protein